MDKQQTRNTSRVNRTGRGRANAPGPGKGVNMAKAILYAATLAAWLANVFYWLAYLRALGD